MFNGSNFITNTVGGYEPAAGSITDPKVNSSFQEYMYSMTNDPGKIWSRGIVHFVMDATLGKFLICLLKLYQFMNVASHTHREH